MSTISVKIKQIYLPFLLIAVLFISTYSFLNWLLLIKLELFSPKEDLINFWLPFALPWIPVLWWLRPRIKMLILTGGNGNLPFLYQFIAALAITVPTMVAQNYLENATGELSNLQNISEMSSMKPVKYYTLKNYYIDKSRLGLQTAFETSGKYSQYLEMNLYVVLPILNTMADTQQNNCKAWLGVKYHKQISNRLEDKEKDEAYDKFVAESQKQFDQTNFNRFVYLKRVGNSNEHDEYVNAIKNAPPDMVNASPVFTAVNEPFEARIGNSLPWIPGSFAIGAAIWFFMLLFPRIHQTFGSNTRIHKQSSTKELKKLLYTLLPVQGAFITMLLVYANVIVFIIMVFAGLGFINFKAQDLLHWGANYGPYISNGQWYRLFSNMFVHGGIMHLLANMMGLFFVGLFLEPILGRARFLIIYLLTGFIASLSSVLWYHNIVSVGASGAIFGMYGVFLSFLLTKVFPPDFGKAFLTSTLFFIGYNLLMGLAGGNDNAAHVGGLVSGLIIGFGLSFFMHEEEESDETSTLSNE